MKGGIKESQKKYQVYITFTGPRKLETCHAMLPQKDLHPNAGPLEEQQGFLTAEPSRQLSLHLTTWKWASYCLPE